ncbi:MAG: twin-arginine translocase subunit TatC [Coriobacteriales bacterium]|jgi:sec-independent protein translocase protein TatC
MPIGPARMPLMDHLGELRRRLVIIVVCLLVACVVLYNLTPYFIEFLKQPIAEFLPEDGTLYTTGAFEGFTLKFRVALWMSLIVCSPIIFWEILAFFLPALKPSERKYVVPTFFVAVALFVLGMVFCYAFCLNAAFQFLTGESYSFADMLPNATDYIHYVILFELAFGIAFELPLVVFYLILFDIVSYKTMRAQWRYIYIGLMVLAAVVTPDASPVTMLILFAALLALYELALLAARIVLAKKIKNQREREKEEEAAEAAQADGA